MYTNPNDISTKICFNDFIIQVGQIETISRHSLNKISLRFHRWLSISFGVCASVFMDSVTEKRVYIWTSSWIKKNKIEFSPWEKQRGQINRTHGKNGAWLSNVSQPSNYIAVGVDPPEREKNIRPRKHKPKIMLVLTPANASSLFRVFFASFRFGFIVMFDFASFYYCSPSQAYNNIHIPYTLLGRYYYFRYLRYTAQDHRRSSRS